LKFKRGWELKGSQPFLFLVGFFVNVKVKGKLVEGGKREVERGFEIKMKKF